MAFAHSKNSAGQRQDLVDHLGQVARLAARFAEALNAQELAHQSGLLHDIGKFNPEFQAYLLNAEANPGKRQRGPDHKGAGACLAASQHLDMLAFLIAGHHGGLPSRAALKVWLRERAADPAVADAMTQARGILPGLTPSVPLPSPNHLNAPLEVEFFVRMLFSALIDADFLDTERHFAMNTAGQRTGTPTLSEMWSRLAESQHSLTRASTGPVNVVRDEVYQHCLTAADLPPGFFRLTVPTGGGKTRSSLAFALQHALRYNLDRVIYAIPYTSIIEQTADVFRDIFRSSRAVLEHHSALVTPDDPQNPSADELWARLAAENWDAPLVVTTTVQLFESLLGRATSACRKLHNVARSAIVLDETQMLPTHLLAPILDVLRQLVAWYGATVVLCTATQPALDDRVGFPGLTAIHDIVPDPARYFERLKRVEYSWPRERWTWQQAAREMAAAHQVLAIVNTRADALALLAELSDPDDPEQGALLHLSTRLCGAHRRAVLAEVRRRLSPAANEPCRLVSTQVIEAGVDVDFPLVLRALGPLDRVVQAAGRCNREGRLSVGRVIVFEPQTGGLPPGPYRTGTQVTQGLMRGGGWNEHDPHLYARYFEELYRQVGLDEPHVQAARTDLDYPETAARFRMIDDDTVSAVVRYGSLEQQERITGALDALRAKRGSAREHLRELQPYLVALRTREKVLAEQQGLIEEVMPGLYEWTGMYDDKQGILLNGANDVERTIW